MLYSIHAMQLGRIQSAGCLTAANPLTRWALFRCACAVPFSLGWRRDCQGAGHRYTEKALYHVLRNTEHLNEKRAEPLAWPCSFALPGLTARGTLLAYAGWRTWGYNALPTLYPHLSTTIQYRSTSGLAPLNKCESSSKTCLRCGGFGQIRAYRGNLAALHRQKTRGRRKPQSAPQSRNICAPNPILLGGLGEDCILISPQSRLTEVQHG